jgi:hypothetical protein
LDDADAANADACEIALCATVELDDGAKLDAPNALPNERIDGLEGTESE